MKKKGWRKDKGGRRREAQRLIKDRWKCAAQDNWKRTEVGKEDKGQKEEEHRDGKGRRDVWKRKAQKEKKGEEARQWQNSCCHFSRLRPQARFGYSCCGCLYSASNEDLTAGQAASAAPPPHAQGLGPVRHAPGPGPLGPSAQGWRLSLPGPRPPAGLGKVLRSLYHRSAASFSYWF